MFVFFSEIISRCIAFVIFAIKNAPGTPEHLWFFYESQQQVFVLQPQLLPPQLPQLLLPQHTQMIISRMIIQQQLPPPKPLLHI